jgi:ATP-dependent RNA helicase DDX51/DBP6
MRKMDGVDQAERRDEEEVGEKRKRDDTSSLRRRHGGDRKRRAYSKPQSSLPFMRNATTIADSGEQSLSTFQLLDRHLHDALINHHNIDKLFPVQSAIWSQSLGGYSLPSDLCVCAPTGCGKTLAYLLPVVNSLASRTVPRLRALVVLPTVGLAQQIAYVAKSLCDAVGLRMVCCAGSGSYARTEESALLEQYSETEREIQVDLVIATPGRLVHHIERMKGFTLEHLRWLVVDEADRLLRQSYHDWLQHVDATSSGMSEESLTLSDIGRRTLRDNRCLLGMRETNPRVQKLVLSATLTRDPAKVHKLNLSRPQYMTVQPQSDLKYTIPSGLKELRAVVSGEKKACALVALLRREVFDRALIFSSSIDTARRLYLLLASLEAPPVQPVEYTSSVPQAQRESALSEFKTGNVNALVASDAATRGMDLQGVDVVINYDVPSYPKTYVHRIGRTARAGRSGRAITIMRPNEARHFKDMVAKAHPGGAVQSYKLDESKELAPLQAECDAALRAAALQASEEEEAAKSGRAVRTLSAAEQLAAQQAERNWNRRITANKG